jgi:hypothetical protein
VAKGKNCWTGGGGVSPPTKLLLQHVVTPNEFYHLSGSAFQLAASPVNGNSFSFSNVPEGGTLTVDFPINPRYDSSGINMKIHWFVDDASHGTAHTVLYTARFSRHNDSIDTVFVGHNIAAFTDAASWVKYINAVSPITTEGTYSAAGTNLHLTIYHDPGCPGSGDLRILCVEFTYFVGLE